MFGRSLFKGVKSVLNIRRFSSGSTLSIQEYGKLLGDSLKTTDFDNHLVGVSMPAAFRNVFYIVRSFNYEMSAIKDSCRGNKAAGELRFQYWANILSEIDDPNVPLNKNFQNPTANALSLFCKTYGVSTSWLQRSLDARRKDLNVTQYNTISEAEDYAEKGHSSLNYFLLDSLGIPYDEKVSFMASHFGVCSGLTTTLQSIPFLDHQVNIPLELTERFSLTHRGSRGAFANVDEQKRFQDAVFELAAQAHGHCDKGRELYHELYPTFPHVKLLAFALIPSVVYLKDLRKHHFYVYAYDLQHPQRKMAMQWALTKLQLINRF